MLLLEALLFISFLFVLGFFRVSPKIWAIGVAIALLALSFLSHFPGTLLFIIWVIFLIFAIFFNSVSVRSKTLMPWILKRFRNLLPPISKSEQTVLDAGDVWWEKDLFCGEPEWEKLRDMPKPVLSEEEKAFLDNQVETLCRMLDDWKIVHEEKEIPQAIWEYIKKEKFLGLVIDKAYGGLGFSHLAHSHIITKISSRSSSVGISVMVPNALGTGEFIQHYGTETQKSYYLPRLVQGEEIPAFALTSTTAGSDAGNLPDVGIICMGEYEGQTVLGIRLNWEKRYITLAPMATILGLAVKLYDPEQLLGGEKNIGTTLCLVPTHLPGVDISKRHYPAGLAFLNGPTCGKDVFIPLDYVIGGVDNCGRGWKMLMEGLAGGRGISLPAFSTANAKVAFRSTGAYAALREQFQTPIGKFEGVQEKLARMGGFTYLCEAARYFMLVGLAQGVKPALASAISKYHITEMVRQVVNDAMDIHGGRGVQWGSRNYLTSLYQTVPVSITVEGANILTRNMMIFGQGAMRCHPFVRDEIVAASDPDKAHGALRFDILICRHVGYTVSNFVKTFFYGLTGGSFIVVKTDALLTRYCRQLTRMSVALAFVTDIMTLHFGGTLKRRERFSARLGDMLSQLYLASAAMKYFHDQNSPVEDIPFVTWSVEKCLFEIQTALVAVCQNLTPRWLGGFIYRTVFPWGMAYRLPEDTVEHQIAEAMLKPSIQRDRITAFCYVSKEKNDPLGRMEYTLAALEATVSLRKKLQTAVQQLGISKYVILSDQIEQVAKAGMLSDDELTTLRDFEALLTDAMKVDVFDK